MINFYTKMKKREGEFVPFSPPHQVPVSVI